MADDTPAPSDPVAGSTPVRAVQVFADAFRSVTGVLGALALVVRPFSQALARAAEKVHADGKGDLS